MYQLTGAHETKSACSKYRSIFLIPQTVKLLYIMTRFNCFDKKTGRSEISGRNLRKSIEVNKSDSLNSVRCWSNNETHYGGHVAK